MSNISKEELEKWALRNETRLLLIAYEGDGSSEIANILLELCKIVTSKESKG